MDGALQLRKYEHRFRVTLMVLAKKMNVLIPKRHNTQTFLLQNVLHAILFSPSFTH